jgi:hypothetical protein
VRFIDAARLREMLAPNAAEADLETELDGVTSLEVLRSRRWLVDVTGAPLLSASSVSVEELGRDPVLDAITALDYVETALTQATSVDRWSDGAFDPTYPTSEDDFPAPEDGSGVTRYDLRRADLPAISSAGTGDAQGVALPAARHFREMAIYVKDGRVVTVLERIEASGKRLQDLLEYTRVALEEFNVEEQIRAQFEAGVAQATTEQELAQLLFAAINVARVGIGEQPITTRVMSLSVPEPEDAGDTTVAMPTENAVQGSLAAMVASSEAQAFFLQGEEQGGGGAPGDLLDTGATTEGGTVPEGGAPPAAGAEAEPAAP